MRFFFFFFHHASSSELLVSAACPLPTLLPGLTHSTGLCGSSRGAEEAWGGGAALQSLRSRPLTLLVMQLFQVFPKSNEPQTESAVKPPLACPRG